jgi:hypothetical protein
MESTSRRKFIRNAGVAVAAAGVASTVSVGAVKALEPDTPPIPDDARAEEAVVARVRDVRKGEVVLYTGEREVAVKDKRLAALLFHATR